MGARRLMGRAAARSAPLGAAAALLLLSAVVPASADSATCTDTPTGSTQCTLAAYLTGQGQVRAYALQHHGTIEARRAGRGDADNKGEAAGQAPVLPLPAPNAPHAASPRVPASVWPAWVHVRGCTRGSGARGAAQSPDARSHRHPSPLAPLRRAVTTTSTPSSAQRRATRTSRSSRAASGTPPVAFLPAWVAGVRCVAPHPLFEMPGSLPLGRGGLFRAPWRAYLNTPSAARRRPRPESAPDSARGCAVGERGAAPHARGDASESNTLLSPDDETERGFARVLVEACRFS